MPIIRLRQENSREAICLVFEKVNVGGKKLDAFELVTAIYASDNSICARIGMADEKHQARGRRAQDHRLANRRDVLPKLASTDFLQAARFSTRASFARQSSRSGQRERNCLRSAATVMRSSVCHLRLTEQYADAVEAGFVAARRFLNEQKIIWHQRRALSAADCALGRDSAILGSKARYRGRKEKLASWFWSVAFGELYGSSTESRLARDVPELGRLDIGEERAAAVHG